jgi:hypothetical protein
MEQLVFLIQREQLARWIVPRLLPVKFSDRQRDWLQFQPMSFQLRIWTILTEPKTPNLPSFCFHEGSRWCNICRCRYFAPWPSGQPDQRMISGRVVVSSSVAHTTKTACHVIGDFIEPIGEGSDRLPCYTISLPVPVGHPRSSFQKTDSEGLICQIWHFFL